MRDLIRLLGIFLLLLIPFFACMDFGGGETEGCGPYEWDWGDGNPCEGVVCPPDDNVCTREFCSGGSCTSEPVTNGRSCTYDGLEGVCVAGVCGENLCEGVDCNDEPCSSGSCDYADGLCDYTPRFANGTPCTYDGLEGVCAGGICGENLCEDVDCDDGDACTEDTCDYVDGTCDFTPVVCDDDEECTEDTCDPTDGCIFTAVEDGTSCGGTYGVCEAGACVDPCDLTSDEEYPCPITGSEDLLCCPGYQYCRGSCPEYTHDFESLDRASRTALSEDGWLVFGQVFDGSGALKFDYGPFPAPNGGQAFSAIVTGEGSPDQGAQQLLVYNDYNCCDPPNQGHFNGTDRVTSLVFQQPFTLGNPISADDVGKTLEFSFDAKRGNINDPTGSSTAVAFIQTVDPNAGFAQTNFVSVDMTSLPAGTWDLYSISLTIDAGLVGQLLEFGFLTIASNFEPSGVLCDNILAALETP